MMEVDKAFVTPKNQNGVDAMNAVDLCGVKNWEIGKEVEVTSSVGNANCPLGELPSTRYDVVKVEDEKLFLALHRSFQRLAEKRQGRTPFLTSLSPKIE